MLTLGSQAARRGRWVHGVRGWHCAAPLRKATAPALPRPSPPPASQGLFDLVLLSTAAFGSSTIAELVYRKVNLRSSQDLLSFFKPGMQTSLIL